MGWFGNREIIKCVVGGVPDALLSLWMIPAAGCMIASHVVSVCEIAPDLFGCS